MHIGSREMDVILVFLFFVFAMSIQQVGLYAHPVETSLPRCWLKVLIRLVLGDVVCIAVRVVGIIQASLQIVWSVLPS